MKRKKTKKMILEKIKLIIAIIITVIAVGLYIKTSFLIIINKNGIDLEEIERMQNEKDESQRQDESGN